MIILLLRIVLFPFGIFYIFFIHLRNQLYQAGIFRSFRFEVPVISVGNLRAGGTGKTPMVEYLIRLLSREYRICTLSRGYKRKTKGFRLASEKDTPATIGDEPFQFFNKWKDTIQVAIGEDRAFAIPNILSERPETELVLLDDAYQHRSVTPSLNLLLTTYSHPFFKDHIMPFGWLREFRMEAKRSDGIVVTKCPEDLSLTEREILTGRIRKYAPGREIFFSYLKYEPPVPFEGVTVSFTSDILLVSGIADAQPLENYLSGKYKLVRHLRFPDHHHYRGADILKIAHQYKPLGNTVSILTTEKDMVKFAHHPDRKLLETLPMFYIPIIFGFIDNGSKFDKLVLESVKNFQQQT